MKNLIRTDNSVARKFNKTFRYIDELLTPRFINSIGLSPRAKNHRKSHLHYHISDLKAVTDLYDKREAFNFRIP